MAAVLRRPGQPLDVCELDLAPPARDEVVVRIEATGICRSDLSYIDGKWPIPLPIVLGHEGAGTIEAVGDGVDPNRLASFATHAVVSANGALAIGAGLDPALACLLGWGVSTGVLSVTRRAGVRPGESVAIFGCGGVGLAAVLGARLVSALPVIAVDPVAAKRELALALGATHPL